LGTASAFEVLTPLARNCGFEEMKTEVWFLFNHCDYNRFAADILFLVFQQLFGT
jgi:hypothetical protein